MERHSNNRACRLGFVVLTLASLAVGCRGYSYGHLIKNSPTDLVGSHTAGSEVYGPLVEESVGRLLGTQDQLHPPMIGADGNPVPRSVCFCRVEKQEHRRTERFQRQIYELVDARSVEHPHSA